MSFSVIYEKSTGTFPFISIENNSLRRYSSCSFVTLTGEGNAETYSLGQITEEHLFLFSLT